MFRNDKRPHLPAVLLVSLLSVCLPQVASAKSTLTDHPEVKGAIAITDAWLQALLDFRQLPGMSVGFVVDQEIIFSKGYGYANPRRKRAADTDTIYSICSISKLFTSIGVMQFRDQGKLTLRDEVGQHLNWFNIQQDHKDAGPTRIEGLLTHSSGLPRESDFPYWSDKQHKFPDRAQMKEKLSDQTTLYPADSLFQYSNLALTLAGEIVRQYAGVDYESYVQRHILGPLQMTDTRPRFPEELRGKQMAIGFSGLNRELERDIVKPFHTNAIAPAAGFTSTVNDLAKFASWNFRTLAGEENSVLAPNSLREMQRVHWVDPDWKTTWGLGFEVAKSDAGTEVGHSGGCPGFITNFTMVPKHKVAAIALTSAGDGPAYEITDAMLATIGKAVKTAADDKSPAPDAKGNEPKPDLALYTGSYGGGDWGGEVLIRIWDDQLAVVQVPSDKLKVTKLRHDQDHAFIRLTDDGEERERWHFQTDAEGTVTHLKIHGSVREKVL